MNIFGRNVNADVGLLTSYWSQSINYQPYCYLVSRESRIFRVYLVRWIIMNNRVGFPCIVNSTCSCTVESPPPLSQLPADFFASYSLPADILFRVQTNRFPELREITKEKDGTSSSKRNTCDAGAIEGDVPRKI
jgi:hypothetical protein